MREYKVPELSAHIMKQLKQVGKVQYHFFLQNALTSYACSIRKTTEKQFLWYVLFLISKKQFLWYVMHMNTPKRF